MTYHSDLDALVQMQSTRRRRILLLLLDAAIRRKFPIDLDTPDADAYYKYPLLPIVIGR